MFARAPSTNQERSTLCEECSYTTGIFGTKFSRLHWLAYKFTGMSAEHDLTCTIEARAKLR